MPRGIALARTNVGLPTRRSARGRTDVGQQSPRNGWNQTEDFARGSPPSQKITGSARANVIIPEAG